MQRPKHGCPMTFQSDNGTAFVGELTKELMRRSQVAQAHSTTYHPQTNGLVERQNRTLVSMLRVYCSRYMTDWDRYLPQVMGAYNSTQHSTTGSSPHMMLTRHDKSLPLTFFYPEYEGKKTSPQVHLRDEIRRQILTKHRQGRGKNLTRKQLVQNLTNWDITYG